MKEEEEDKKKEKKEGKKKKEEQKRPSLHSHVRLRVYPRNQVWQVSSQKQENLSKFALRSNLSPKSGSL